jgi:hypothetical protein
MLRHVCMATALAACHAALADVTLAGRKAEWLGTPELMREMERGGFVIYFRHGLTNWSEKLREQRFTTQRRFDLANCASQRNLSEEGRAEARMIRFAMEHMGIPVGRVYASQYCRPAEHVQIVTGKVPERVFWLTGLGRPETLPRLRERASTPPEPGANVILGDHGDLIYNVTDWVIEEGDAVVFRPEPPSYKAIAWIRPHEWLALARAVEAARGVAAPALTDYEVSGDNPLAQSDTRAVLAPFMGKSGGIDTRYAASAALEAALRERGHGTYAVKLVDRDAAATLGLRVERAVLADIRVKGNTLSSEAAIRAAVPALRANEAPDTVAAARQLLAANENPARTINVLYATGARPGTLDADVEVTERRPWSLVLRADNSGTDASGRARTGLALEHANLFGAGHIARGAFVTTPDKVDDTRQWGGSYTVPVPRFAGALTGYWARSTVDAGSVDGVMSITGAGHFGGLRYRHQLAPRADFHSDVFFSLEDRYYSGAGLPANVRSRPIALGYAGHWEEQWIGWNFAIEYARNLGSGPANDDATYALVRPSAGNDWSALRARADFTRILTYDLRLILRARAQIARDPLIRRADRRRRRARQLERLAVGRRGVGARIRRARRARGFGRRHQHRVLVTAPVRARPALRRIPRLGLRAARSARGRRARLRHGRQHRRGCALSARLALDGAR